MKKILSPGFMVCITIGIVLVPLFIWLIALVWATKDATTILIGLLLLLCLIDTVAAWFKQEKKESN
jgi:uncharacterized membrane protein